MYITTHQWLDYTKKEKGNEMWNIIATLYTSNERCTDDNKTMTNEPTNK